MVVFCLLFACCLFLFLFLFFVFVFVCLFQFNINILALIRILGNKNEKKETSNFRENTSPPSFSGSNSFPPTLLLKQFIPSPFSETTNLAEVVAVFLCYSFPLTLFLCTDVGPLYIPTALAWDVALSL